MLPRRRSVLSAVPLFRPLARRSPLTPLVVCLPSPARSQSTSSASVGGSFSRAGSSKGAKEVGALKSADFQSLTAGNYLIYSGVYKKKTEADPVRMRPHPYEFHLYYDI